MPLDRDALREAAVNLGRHLSIRPGIDEGTLAVDCSAIITNRDDPVVWILHYDAGKWHHYPSGESGPLFAVLFAIAHSYIDFAAGSPSGETQ